MNLGELVEKAKSSTRILMTTPTRYVTGFVITKTLNDLKGNYSPKLKISTDSESNIGFCKAQPDRI